MKIKSKILSDLRRKNQLTRRLNREKSETQKKREAESIREYFKKMYDNTENWEPSHPKEMTNKSFNNFRWVASYLVRLPLSLSAKAIYPVMCCEADFKNAANEFQTSIETIGAKTGISSWKSVKVGLKELSEYWIETEGFEKILHSRKHRDAENRQYNLYKVWFPRNTSEGGKVDSKLYENGIFPFHRSIIESGVWAELTNRQKVFWLGLRSVAKMSPEANEYAYGVMESDDFEQDTYCKALSEREYDVWAGSRAQLLRDIGIQNVNIYREVVMPLEEFGLIEQLSIPMGSKKGSVYKVFFVPTNIRIEMDRRKNAQL